MARIEVSEKFKNQIKKVKDDVVMDRVKKEFKALLKDPNLGKPLKYALKGFGSIRIGKYRFIYALEDYVVRVYSFEHRKGVYKR